jgi:hypothetical protein
VYNLASFKINLIEFGVSIAILAGFIALFAIAGDIAGEWSNFAYLDSLVYDCHVSSDGSLSLYMIITAEAVNDQVLIYALHF